jgi:antitoxin component YwqK of YwqJK toxin-antitoxin module
MKTLKALLLLFFLATQAVFAQGFFYFGNSNLVGTGKTVGTSKEGVWKIYARKELADNPTSAVAEVGEEVLTNFNLAFPLYQMEFKGNQIDGVFEEFYPEGTAKKLVNYQRGMLHGDFFEFGRKGEVLLSGAYFQGEKTGDWFVYRADGTIKSEYSYQNNLLNGVSTTYFSPGQVAERIPFELGLVNGTYESFFPNGTTKQRLSFLAGQEDGEFKQFHADGKLAIAANFSKGALEGTWQSYDERGQLLAEGGYQQGERTGQWKEIYPEVLGFYTTGNYEADKKAGTWKVLGAADFVHQEEVFQEGMLLAFSAFTTRSGLVLDAGDLAKGDGRRTLYDGEGHRLEKGRYANGLRTGIWYAYFPQTSLVASSGSYVAGQKRGTWKQFDFQGQLVSEEVFSTSFEESERTVGSATTSDSPKSRSYLPLQTTGGGMVNSQVLVTTPDGMLGISGPGLFQRWD